MNINKIKQIADKYSKNVVEYRHKLHSNPELSFNETKTSRFISDVLKKNNILHNKGFVKTGIVAIIKGAKKGKTIAIRADIDALPIQEQNVVSYKSCNSGVMHACGHDVHTASLLGAALILNELKNEISGTYLFVFQPAEEKLPGGAKQMLKENVFGKYKPDVVLAQHVNPSMKAGTVGFKSGMYMASTDEIYLTVKGKGGHAAMPHQITDTVLVASQIIVNLQQIVSRKTDSSIPTVLSFGKVIANGATNVIPDKVNIEGTFRTMNEKWRKDALQLIKSISQNTAKTFGATCDVNIVNGYPSLINNEKVTELARKYASAYLGKKNVVDMGIRMTAEDFSYFAQQYPATLYRLGTAGNSLNTNNPLHSANFNIDENVLKYSHGLLAWLAVSFSENN